MSTLFMKFKFLILQIVFFTSSSVLASSIYDFTINSINGDPISFKQYKGKYLLIVNTASQCGFTPQLAELESLYKKYKSLGFVVLAFPSNDFKQDPEELKKINEFASKNYGVTFPFFEKIKVTGSDKHPLYQLLTEQKKGLFTSEVSWNFEKFLVDRDGNVVDRFNSMTSPTGSIQKILEKRLK